jgi:hypothetical protein
VNIYEQSQRRKEKIESLQRTILWMCNQIQDAIDRLPDEAGYSKMVLQDILTDERHSKR